MIPVDRRQAAIAVLSATAITLHRPKSVIVFFIRGQKMNMLHAKPRTTSLPAKFCCPASSSGLGERGDPCVLLTVVPVAVG